MTALDDVEDILVKLGAQYKSGQHVPICTALEKVRQARAEISLWDKHHQDHHDTEVAQDIETGRANEAIAELLSKNAILLALLKESEWTYGGVSDERNCWSCLGVESMGHAPGCALAAALKEGGK